MGRLGTLIARRSRLVLGLASVSLAFGLVVAAGTPTALVDSPRAFNDPGSEASQARAHAEAASGATLGDGIVLLVEAPPGAPAVRQVERELRTVPGIARVRAPQSRAPSPLVARDGRRTLVVAAISADADLDAVTGRVEHRFGGRPGLILGGEDVARAQLTAQVKEDLTRAELLAFPLLALLCVLIFRGLAAILPLIVALLSVTSTFTLLRVVDEVVAVSPFALNLVLALGLGLSVDFSLLMVSRFREEAGRRPVIDAVVGTMSSAGRAVAYSAMTVALALSVLAVFPQRFMVSMAIGGVLVALCAALSALVVIPALLARFGPHVQTRSAPPARGRWYDFAHAVMRRPLAVALATTAVLLLLAAPALRAAWTGIDAGALPTERSARTLQDSVAAGFATDETPLAVVVKAPASASPAVGELARRIAGLPAAQSVAAPLRLNATTWRIDATASGTPIGPQARQLLTELRGLTTPFAVSVGGIAADYHDDQHAILERVPLALSALCLITLVLLWLLTDSVVLPVKALVMTGVTTAAALGLLVLIFQDGRLTGPLDYVSQGALEQTNFVVFAALVFALSTDYGVMLIARIQEEHAAGLDNREAVAVGIQRTGSLLSGAAVLLATALGVLATSSIVFVKELGVGTAVAVLIDAFVIRCLLLPSLMALLGDRNWWSPEWLHRVHRRMAHSISTVQLSPDTPEGPALTTLPKGPDRTPSV